MTPIEVLLKLQWPEIVALAAAVTVLTQGFKTLFKSVTGNWILPVPGVLSLLFCYYVYGFVDPMKAVIAALFVFTGSVLGWQTLKGSTSSGVNSAQNGK